MLCIAHRLNTIMDYDRVVVSGQLVDVDGLRLTTHNSIIGWDCQVMGDGGVLEFDTPAKLLADKTSSLYGMAEQTGHAQHLEDIANGRVDTTAGA